MNKTEYKKERDRLVRLLVKYDEQERFSAGDRVAKSIDRLDEEYYNK